MAEADVDGLLDEAEPVTSETALHLYRQMLRIRRFEERTIREALQGSIHGLMHPYIGQEAVAVGVCSHLDQTDYITSTHRGNGHAIAKGAPLDGMMAELFGREGGLCRGRGGPSHITDLGIGLLGANGIVAGGIAIAVGAAWAAAISGTDAIAVSFFGESASSRGPFHEALNLAAVWQLSVLFVCENNLYGQYTPSERAMATPDVADRAAAYNMASAVIDGMDAVEVYGAAAGAIERVRGGRGPFLLECKTYRFMGHALGDSEYYRSKEEVEQWRERDPLTLLLSRYPLPTETLNAIEAEVENEVESAVRFADASPYPAPETLYEDVFAE